MMLWIVAASPLAATFAVVVVSTKSCVVEVLTYVRYFVRFVQEGV